MYFISFSRKIWVVCVLLFLNLQIIAQEIPDIDPEEVPDFQLTRNETFDGPSLWGYMNGGADIYLEYGFEILRVQEFTHEDENLKMELYKMSDPISAFGIYSIKSFKCRESGMLASIDCLNPYQYQIQYGDYYISITNESGSAEAKPFMLEMAQTILPRLEYEELLLPCTWLTDTTGLSPQEIKMIMGSLGIQNKAPKLTGMFDGINPYQVYFASMEKEGKRIQVYQIVVDDADQKERFMQNDFGKDLQLLNENGSILLLEN